MAFRVQASEISIIDLDGYEQIYTWRGALPKAKARLGLGVVVVVLVLAGALLAGCAASPPADDPRAACSDFAAALTTSAMAADLTKAERLRFGAIIVDALQLCMDPQPAEVVAQLASASR